MKYWVIINMTCIIDIGSDHLATKYRPKFVHEDKKSAENEILRLQQKYPNGKFFLFESVAMTESVRGMKNIFRIEPL